MKKRFLMLAICAFAFLALLSAGVNNCVPAKVFAQQQVANQQVTVIGESSTKLVADMAKVSCNINMLNSSMEKAKDMAFEKYSTVKSILTENNIAEENVNLIYFSTFPNYDYNNYKTITGYSANLSFEFDVDGLENIKPIVDAISSAGEVNISSINYQVKNYADEYNRILQEAIQNATEKAKILLGKDDVEIKNIVEQETYNSCCLYKSFVAEQSSDFNSKITLNAKVTVIFE